MLQKYHITLHAIIGGLFLVLFSPDLTRGASPTKDIDSSIDTSFMPQCVAATPTMPRRCNAGEEWCVAECGPLTYTAPTAEKVQTAAEAQELCKAELRTIVARTFRNCQSDPSSVDEARWGISGTLDSITCVNETMWHARYSQADMQILNTCEQSYERSILKSVPIDPLVDQKAESSDGCSLALGELKEEIELFNKSEPKTNIRIDRYGINGIADFVSQGVMCCIADDVTPYGGAVLRRCLANTEMRPNGCMKDEGWASALVTALKGKRWYATTSVQKVNDAWEAAQDQCHF
jgi:hypothetical protein